MMATVPHVTSGSGLRKFQADGFLFDRVYKDKQLGAHCSTVFVMWLALQQFFQQCVSAVNDSEQ